MSIRNVPIKGYESYLLDLSTHEITNGKGKVMKKRLDKRGTLIINLVDHSGKQRTVKVNEIVENTVRSLEIVTSSSLILADVLVAYYNLFDEDFKYLTLQEMSKEIHKYVPKAELIEIGRIVDKIY